jgi:hypothetical protein
MKGLFATAIMLASAVSVWAQGQIVVTGSEVLTRASDPLVSVALPIPLSISPEPLPSRLLPVDDNSDLSDRPFSGSRILLQSDQTASPSIQAVPEPSTFALGGLALGLIALFRASVKAKNVA